MGSTLTKEEEAVVKLLQLTLSVRALTDLLQWERDRNLISGVSAALELSTWEAIGLSLSDDISSKGKEGKEARKYSTLWKLIREILQCMKEERVAAASASAASNPKDGEDGSGAAAAPSSPTNPFAHNSAIPGPRVAARAPLPAGHLPGPVTALRTGGARRDGPQPAGAEAELQPHQHREGAGPACGPEAGLDPLHPPLHPPLPVSAAAAATPAHRAAPQPPVEELLKEILDELNDLRLQNQGSAAKPFTGQAQGSLAPPPAPAAAARPSPRPPENLFTPALQDSNNFSQRWKGIIKDAIIEGSFIPQTLPFTVYPGGQGCTWAALDCKLLQRARSAIAQYGLHSQLTEQIIRFIFTADLLTPFDSLQVASVLLTPLQRLMFKSTWQSLCDAEQAKPRQQNDPLYGVQSQMLTGTGQFASAQVQSQFTVEVLQLSQQLALQAILSVHEPVKPYGFTHIKQGPTDSYAQFVDKLYSAIDSHPDLDETVKQLMFKVLAFENANEKTKQALGTLPMGAEVADMIDLAERTTQFNKAACVAAAVKAAIAPLFNQTRGGKDRRCFNCGRLGHLKFQCKAAKQSKWCVHCQKSSHDTIHCRHQGKRRRRAKQGAWPASQWGAASTPLPPPQVPEGTWKQR